MPGRPSGRPAWRGRSGRGSRPRWGSRRPGRRRGPSWSCGRGRRTARRRRTDRGWSRRPGGRSPVHPELGRSPSPRPPSRVEVDRVDLAARAGLGDQVAADAAARVGDRQTGQALGAVLGHLGAGGLFEAMGVKYIRAASSPNFATARRRSPAWVSAAEDEIGVEAAAQSTDGLDRPGPGPPGPHRPRPRPSRRRASAGGRSSPDPHADASARPSLARTGTAAPGRAAALEDPRSGGMSASAGDRRPGSRLRGCQVTVGHPEDRAGCLVGHRVVHRWAVEPLQVRSSTRAPLVVARGVEALA